MWRNWPREAKLEREVLGFRKFDLRYKFECKFEDVEWIMYGLSIWYARNRNRRSSTEINYNTSDRVNIQPKTHWANRRINIAARHGICLNRNFKMNRICSKRSQKINIISLRILCIYEWPIAIGQDGEKTNRLCWLIPFEPFENRFLRLVFRVCIVKVRSENRIAIGLRHVYTVQTILTDFDVILRKRSIYFQTVRSHFRSRSRFRKYQFPIGLYYIEGVVCHFSNFPYFVHHDLIGRTKCDDHNEGSFRNEKKTVQNDRESPFWETRDNLN